MKPQGDGKGKWGWWLIVVSVLVFFGPIVLQPTGVPFYRGASYSDLLIAHLPSASFIRTALIDWGQIPLWNPTIYGGAPFAADPLSGMAYLPTWAAVAFPIPLTFNLLLYFHLIWAAFGCVILARKIGMTDTAGVVFGLAFAGTPKLFAHIGLGHISLVYAVCWTPWLLVAVTEMIARLGRKQSNPLPAISTGVVMGLIFLADPRWSLPSLLLAGGYALHRWFLAPKKDRPSARQLLKPGFYFVGFASGIAALLSIPLWQYLQLSTRADLSLEASNALALDWVHLLGFIQPFLAQAEQVVYVGVGVVILALVGVTSRKPGSGFWSVVFVGALILSLGSHTPLFPLITRWLPGAGFLRVPTRFLFLAALAVAALAGFGLDSLLETVKNAGETKHVRRATLVIVSGVLVLNLASAWLRFGILLYQLITIGIALMAAVLIGWTLRSKFSTRLLNQLWLLLILVDLSWVNWSLIVVKPYALIQGERIDVAESLARPYGEARSYSPSYAIPQLTAIVHKLEMVEGVNPLQLRSYYDYLQAAVGFEKQDYGVTLPPFPSGDPKIPWKGRMDIGHLERLNVVSVVSDYPLEEEFLALIEKVDGVNLYAVEGARPRAWVASTVDETWMPAELINWTSNRIQVQAQGPGRLVLSEVAYPGWVAELDGQPTELRVSDGLFRSVMVPPGPHEITFSFHPGSVYLGLAIFGITLLAGAYLAWRR